jgi:hypothetical protein
MLNPLRVAALGLLLTACSAPASPVETSVASPLSSSQATAHFRTDAWAPTLDGTITAGATLRIDYDPARLPECRQLNSNEAWDMQVHYRFDGGPISDAVIADPGMSLRVNDVIAIPEGASVVTMWFENFARTDGGEGAKVCQAWDSVYGANYSFGIAAP